MDIVKQEGAAPGLLGRADAGLNALLSAISSIWIFAVMALICMDVAMRALFNRPISGVVEFVALSVAGFVFLQLPSAIANRRLLRAEMLIDPLEKRLPQSAGIFNLVYVLVGAFLFAKILQWAWPDFLRAYASGEFAGTPGAYQIPVWPFKFALIIGSTVALVQFLKLAVIEAIGVIRRRSEAGAGFVAYLPGLVFLLVLTAFIAFLFINDPRPITVGIYCLGAMLVLVMLGMPIPLALMGISYLGIWIARGSEINALNTLGLAASSAAGSYEFGVIPLFIMMGVILEKADVGRDAFQVAAAILRRLRGGLGMATVFANAIFASIVGSSVASAAVFSRIAVPEMVTHGYTKRFSVGCVAGSSVLGMLIPPSLLLIIYGLVAEVSVGRLFIAAIVPGVILALAFCIGIYLMAVFTPRFVGAPRPADDMPAMSIAEMLVKLGPIVILVAAVVGGIYGGIFTPTEAAAVGTAFAFVIAFARRRLDWATFKAILLETGFVSAVILFLIVAANLYTRQVALTGIPMRFADWVTGAGLDMTGFLAVYFVVVFLLGMIIDSVSIILIMLPIVLPVLEALDGSKIWFGIVTTIAVEIGLLTPPFGLAVYVVKGVLPKDFISLNAIFTGAAPFVALMILVTILIMAYPDISLWLVFR
ncbi:TRAP transporter large permease subunit [Pseudorhodoplanes sp.]|uniref:TRAP transporter large permease subunit n=1 Tax=Pseudorhodoplanes sp. TaxID=1934341 RepID=UPI00391A169B